MGRDDRPKEDPILDAFDVSDDDIVPAGDGSSETETVLEDDYIKSLGARLDGSGTDAVRPEPGREREGDEPPTFQDRTTEKIESELRGRASTPPRSTDSVPPPAVREGRLQVYVLCGPDAGRSLPLRGERIVVGRDPGCDLVLGDGSVSREHLLLTRREGRWHFQDLDSENGTYVDGQWKKSGPLVQGEPVELGRTMLVLEGSER
jgi:hypothetical protein